MPFDWHVYLSETGAELSPPVLFDHVSRSLEPLVHKGETLEVLWSVGSTNPGEQKWWPAEVVLVSGYLLLLKWWVPEKPVTELNPVPPASKRPMKCPKIPSVTNNEGFWFDVKGSNWDRVRQIGWCRSKNIAWTPPDHVLTVDAALLSPFSEYEEKLQKRSVARPFFEQHALYPFETIRSGGYLECEHEDNPGCVWPAKVLMNIGGRVKLAWFGTDVKQSVNGGADPKSIFTLFYLHRRIHLLGWGKIYGLKYCPPPDVTVDRAISNIDAFIRGAPSAFTLASDQDGGNKLKSIRAGHPMYQRDPPLHEFKKGWKVEAVNPLKPYLVQPATIAEVFNSRYFLVELDDLRHLPGNDNSESTWKVKSELPKPIRFVCHAGSSVIMPVNTSQLRGIHLAPPPGWPEKRPFTWTNYLTFLSMASNPPHCVNDSSETLTAECLVPDDLKVSACIKQSLFTDQGLTPSESSSDATDGCSSHVCAGNTLLHADCIPYCPPEAMFRGIRISGSFSGQSEVNRSNTIPQPNSIPNLLEIQTKEPMYSLPVERATSRFLLGMKLEMVISDHLSSHTTQQFAIGPGLCAATVTRVDGPYLLWVLPDLHSAEPIKPIMMDARSTQLYPVGWSAACGHPIVAPEGYANCSVDAETGLPTVDLTCSPSSNYNMDSSIKHWNVELKSTHDLQYHTIEYQNEEVCPPIFINPKCYIGPFLCKTSVELIPRRIGPGPITRVMQYLLTRLISAAYKPVRVLHMFEADWATNLASALNLRPNQPNVGLTHDSIPTRGRFNIHGGRVNVTHAESEMVEQRRSAMQLVVLRIRCPRRGIKVEAPVEVCGRVRAVEEFCRQVSLVLEACPHLLTVGSNSQSQRVKSESNSAEISDFIQAPDFTHDCPSFCSSRLRSRNFDRLPGWKKRMFASLRPFGVPVPPAEFGSNSTVRGIPGSCAPRLRTRSAVAAAQRQQRLTGRDAVDNPIHVIARTAVGLPNGLSIGRTNRGRGCGRFRRSSVRRVGHRILPLNKDAGLQVFPEGLTGGKQSKDIVKAGNQVVDHVNSSTLISCPQKRSSVPYHHLYSPYTLNVSPSLYPTPYCTDFNGNRSNITNPTVSSLQSDYPYFENNYLTATLADAPRVTLTSNPLFWTSVDLASYLGQTDCREMWPWLAAEAVDGQAFMLLTLPVLHHLVGLQWDDAIRLARHVVSVKRAFVEQFSSNSDDLSSLSSRAS